MFSLRSLRIKAMQYLFASFIQQKVEGIKAEDISLSPRDIKKIRQHLTDGIEAIHHLHSTFLQLMTSWAMIEKERASRLMESPATPLYDDPLLTDLRLDPSFAVMCKRYPIFFSVDRVERWYDGYINRPEISLKREEGSEDKTFLVRDLVKYIFKEREIQEKSAQQDMGWQEDRGIVLQRLRRFIKDFAHTPEESFALYDESISADKVDFYVELITKTWQSVEEHTTLLQEKVDNWSLERINVLDRTLIIMALTEIKYFPEIPTKVSINEYLEIAKQYSTPKSVAFINGVVDSVSKGSGSV